MKIAILGATGHIAQNLIDYWYEKYYLFQFSRDKLWGHSYDQLNKQNYDLIINCTGIGTYSNIKDYYSYFKIIEHFDNMCIDYLNINPKTLYVNFSSGVVSEFNKEIKQDNYYAIAKLNSEAKHRSLKHLNIIDIRLYSFFSRYINLNDDYFLNQIIKSIKENKELLITPYEMIRDYISPQDLANFIINLQHDNKVVTVGSLEDISKQEILDYFKQNHGFKYKITDTEIPCATGHKIDYWPEKIDNKPTKTSLETIKEESQSLLMNSE